jgi:uncharacterized protein (DUF4415 family)
MRTRTGDKIRLKTAVGIERRGVVQRADGRTLVVRLEESGRCVRMASDKVTNLSLAARKAWAGMPQRAVGRPKGARVCDRVSVTVRIDRALWEQFKMLEAAGLIVDRTATLNRWLVEKLAGFQRPDA